MVAPTLIHRAAQILGTRITVHRKLHQELHPGYDDKDLPFPTLRNYFDDSKRILGVASEAIRACPRITSGKTHNL